MTGDLRQAILAAAWDEIPVLGVSEAALKRAGERAVAAAADIKRLFPDGAASLVEVFSDWADARMEERMADAVPERVRDKIGFAVRSRIEALAPHKDAARRVTAYLALPGNAALAAKLVFKSVDAMWRAAGDKTSDFNYYTKRALLAGVYGSTLLYWLSDSSDGNEESWKFLNARIGNVMGIQKLRGDVERAVAGLPDPFGILQAFKPTRPR